MENDEIGLVELTLLASMKDCKDRIATEEARERVNKPPKKYPPAVARIRSDRGGPPLDILMEIGEGSRKERKQVKREGSAGDDGGRDQETSEAAIEGRSVGRRQEVR